MRVGSQATAAHQPVRRQELRGLEGLHWQQGDVRQGLGEGVAPFGFGTITQDPFVLQNPQFTVPGPSMGGEMTLQDMGAHDLHCQVWLII